MNLEAIAKEAGVPDESIKLARSSVELRVEMLEDEHFAAQLGSGVPLFVFNNAFSVSGAQPEAIFLEALDQMVAKARTGDSSMMGQDCGIDGSDRFNRKHGSSRAPQAALVLLKIGEIAE